MKRFYLRRLVDETGISGIGIIAEGIEFSNLQVILCWRTFTSSIGVYRNIEDMIRIHGHNGKTIIEWIDSSAPNEHIMVSSLGVVKKEV